MRGGIRTLTPVRAPDSHSGMSTNSNTSTCGQVGRTFIAIFPVNYGALWLSYDPVRLDGFEPPRPHGHLILSQACLPFQHKRIIAGAPFVPGLQKGTAPLLPQSRWQDLNLRSPESESGRLPNFPTPRWITVKRYCPLSYAGMVSHERIRTSTS